MESEKNPSIGCQVSECKYHAQANEYCTLDKIMVGKHESQATTTECTDCRSFEVK